ncbi:MAG: putative Ig domain-containing protein [Deltaproteobacteria bacterium]
MPDRRLSLVLAVALFACSGEDTPDLLLATAELPQARLGENYDERIAATGGTTPYSFALAEGTLHAGIELRKDTGQLVGTPTEPGRRNLTFSVTDADGATASQAIELYVIPDPLTIVTETLPEGRVGDAYAADLEAMDGVAPYTWRLESGTLPDGLDVSGRQISGTPTESGAFQVTVAVEDADGAARTQRLSLMVAARAPMFTTMMLDKARVLTPYDATIEAEGGAPPYTFAIATGALPAGLTLGTDGALNGTPEEAGEFMFTVEVVDSASERAELPLMLRVLAPLEIATVALPQIVAGRGIDYDLEASGGEPPYAWSVTGDLPAGVTLSAEGHLAGTSMDFGDYPITLRVTDADGFRRSALFTLRVADRYTYGVSPQAAFPPVCTGTTVSYTSVDIPVADSFAIEDLDVTVDISFSGNNRNTRLALISPSGHPVVLCGDGVYRGRQNAGRVPGGAFCGGSNGFDLTFNDQGGQASRPELPLSRVNGENAQGTWRLLVGVSNPNCNNAGTIDLVELSIRDDRATDDYYIIGGWTPNNRLGEPWLRITGGGVDENELFLTATRYSVGPNGVREGGKGDDVADPTALTWEMGGFQRGQSDLPFDGNVSPDGHVTSGSATGTATLRIVGTNVTVPVHFSPPSWVRDSRLY